MAFYSQYTGQNINPVPAGYLQANAQSALMMQKGLASIGEAIGKYRKDKEQDEQDEMLAEAAKMAEAARERNKSKKGKGKGKGKKLPKGKLAPSKKDAVTRTDISPKPVMPPFGLSEEPAPGPQGLLVPPARDEPLSPAIGLSHRSKGRGRPVPQPAPQPDFQASMSAYGLKPIPTRRAGQPTQGSIPPAAPPNTYNNLKPIPTRSQYRSGSRWSDIPLRDRTPWGQTADDVVLEEGFKGPLVPPSADMGQVEPPLMDYGNPAPDAQRAYGMDYGIPAPYKPRVQGLDAGIPAPEKGRATGVDIAEKKRRVTVNSQLSSWLEQYGKDANADTIKSAYLIFDKAREDKRTERQDKRDRRDARFNRNLAIDKQRLAQAQEARAVEKHHAELLMLPYDMRHKAALTQQALRPPKASGTPALSPQAKQMDDIQRALDGPGGLTEANILIKRMVKSGPPVMTFESNPDGSHKVFQGTAGQLTSANRTKFQALAAKQGLTIKKAKELKKLLNDKNVGAKGVLSDVVSKSLGQIIPGLADKDVTEARTAIKLFRDSTLREVSDDSKFSNADRDAIRTIFPEDGVFESAPRVRAKLDQIIKHFENRNKYFTDLIDSNQNESDWERMLPHVAVSIQKTFADPNISDEEKQNKYNRLAAGLKQMGATNEDIIKYLNPTKRQ